MLRREVVVAELRTLVIGGLEDAVCLGTELRLLRRLPVDLGQRAERLVGAVAHRRGRDVEPLEHRQHDALGLADEAHEDVLRRDLRVVPLARHRLGGTERFAGLPGELVGVERHGSTSE